MGRQRTRARKLIRFCLTCLIFFILIGCAELRETRQTTVEEKEPRKAAQCPQPAPCPPLAPCPPPAPSRLAHAKKLLAQGDIEGALRESQKWSSGKNPPADEALFTMGLAFIHHKNPKRDYRQAAEHFDKLVREFPQSPLADQAMTWIGVLHVMEQSKQVDIEIEKMKKELVR